MTGRFRSGWSIPAFVKKLYNQTYRIVYNLNKLYICFENLYTF